MAEQIVELNEQPLSLSLVVRDPEVIAELRRRPDGHERDAHALAALRLGVSALRMASGQVDGESIRNAGAALLSEMREVLTERAAGMQRELQRFFDPSSGLLQQRLERLVSDQGELAELLDTHLGGEGSVLAETLAQHLGEKSKVFEMLSPGNAQGLKVQLERTIAAALEQQRAALVREFSLDQPGSALARLAKLLQGNQAELAQNLTLDNEQSALSRLRREIMGTLEAFTRRSGDFEKQIAATLAAMQTKREVENRTAAHGATFEDALGAQLESEARRHGDVCEATGNVAGEIARCKTGDFVVELSAESAAPGERVVWEAKANAAYTLKKALDEMHEARKNRAAQLGVFVFAGPCEHEPFARHGETIVVVWDHEDPATDIHLRAAYSVSRALACKAVRESAQSDEAAQKIRAAVRAIEAQLASVEDLRKMGESVQKNGGKIVATAQKLHAELEQQVEALDTHLAAL